MDHPADARGFTLIELVVVVLVVGILAALAFAYEHAAVANANLSGAANDLALQLAGLRSTAMRDGKDYLIVVVDAPGNDGSACNGNPSQCAAVWTLSDPQSTWSVTTFNPASPGAAANVVDVTTMPRGVRFHLASTAVPPAPFNAIVPFDPDLEASCGGRTCMAFRFTALGQVQPELARSTSNQAKGATVALASGLDASDVSATHNLVFVSFPTAIVRNVTY